MRTIYRLAALCGFAGSLFGGSIELEITSLGNTGDGQPAYRYSFILSGFTFEQNQELNFRFDPLIFGALWNAVAPSSWVAILLQPDNPPGAPGDFSLFALQNNPSTAGPFSVDVALIVPPDMISKGQVPVPPNRIPYSVNQFVDSPDGPLFDRTLTRGMALTRDAAEEIPEPGTFVLGGASLGLLVCLRRARRARQAA